MSKAQKKLVIFAFCLLFLSACVNFKIDLRENTMQKSVNSKTFNVEKTQPTPTFAPVMINYGANLSQLRANFNKPNAHIQLFGDSHLAADFFSSHLRTKYIATKGLGFVYPLQPKYQRVSPLSYENKGFELINSKNETGDFAMGGVSARAGKKGALVGLRLESDESYTLVAVFKGESGGKNAFIVKEGGGKKFGLKAESAKKWSFQKISKIKFPLHITALSKGVELGGFFVLANDGKIIDTLGINGAKVDLYSRWDKKTLIECLKIAPADIYMLGYGSNDALAGDLTHFSQFYSDFITLLRDTNPTATIILLAPPSITQNINAPNARHFVSKHAAHFENAQKFTDKNGDIYAISPNFSEVRRQIYDLAKKHQLIVFDMHQVIENSGGKGVWIEQGLSKSDVHLMPDGYCKMADEFYFALQNLMKQGL